MHYDSSGKVIEIGNHVRFRGQEYTIKNFLETKAENGTPHIEFEEDCHTTEVPDEFSVDFIEHTKTELEPEVKEDKLVILQLNDMRTNTEDRHIIGWAESKKDIDNFIEKERVEPYEDQGLHSFSDSATYKYQKRFKKGGPLEWYNFPEVIYKSNYIIDHGSLDHCIEEITKQWPSEKSGLGNHIQNLVNDWKNIKETNPKLEVES